MFDVNLPDSAAICALDDAQLIDAIMSASKLEARVQARVLNAVGELWDRRKKQAEPEQQDLFIDTMEEVSAEVAAAIAVTSSRAAGFIRVGEALRDRLPRVAAVFDRGEIDLAMVSTLVSRTELIDDPDVMAKVDSSLAERAPGWSKYSRRRIGEFVDSWVGRFDPTGVREPRKPTDNRYLDVRASSQGMAGIWANLHVQDAIVFDERIDELVETVCPNDPRTKAQLRADAIRSLADRQDQMTCTCGAANCEGGDVKPPRDIVIHVLTEPSTVDGQGETPGYVSGFGPIAADTVRALVPRARRKPLVVPSDPPAETTYRPSTALAEFVRFRDLFCRFPGCGVPAAACDVDHTIPFVLGGLTHPSNLKCECRKHHLLKTFYVGPEGWADHQLPDGTVVWVAPTGHTYTTKPGGQLYFPALAQPTGDVPAMGRIIVPHPRRNEMMPKRRLTRAEDAARRHASERRRNADRLAVAEHELTRQLIRDHEPPPF